MDPTSEQPAYARQVIRLPITKRGNTGVRVERKQSAKYDRPVWKSDLSQVLSKGLEKLSPKKGQSVQIIFIVVLLNSVLAPGGKWSLLLEEGGSENLGTEDSIRDRLGPLAFDGLNNHEFPNVEKDKALKLNVVFRPPVSSLFANIPNVN